MFEFFFDLPLVITASVIIATLWLFAIVGLLWCAATSCRACGFATRTQS